MKLYIKSSEDSIINKYYNGVKYTIRYSFPQGNEDVSEAQITEVHPYDDADYYWVKIEDDGTVKYVQSGRVKKKEKYSVDDNDEDVIIDKLYKLNKQIAPRMMYD